jgi:hypothetical protein
MSNSANVPYNISGDSSATEVLLIGQLAHSLFMQSLDSSLFHHNITELDLIPLSTSNTQHAAIKPGLAHGLWYSLQRLARIILCAANNYTPGVTEGPLPLTIPIDALTQIGLPIPTIIVAERHHDANPLLFVQHRRFQEIVIRTLQWVGKGGLQWIASAMERSGQLGTESLWHWECIVQMRDAPSLNFGIFKEQVEAELYKVQRGIEMEEANGGQVPALNSEVIIHPFASNNPPAGATRAVNNLRSFLQSIHNIFPPAPVQDNPPTYPPQDVADLIQTLERLHVADIVGIEMDTFE